MPRFTVQMTLAVPARPGPVHGGSVTRRPGAGTVRYLVGDGTVAVIAVVRAETAGEAAADVLHVVERDQVCAGNGPVRLVSWTATRHVPVFAGPGRRRNTRFRGGPETWTDGDDGGGTAGVREPRRPRPSPGSTSAALDPPIS